MAAYATIQQLKNAIHDSIYQNNAGLVTADIVQDRLIDIIDTLLVPELGSYLLPIASANELGGIMIGENLVIDENGVVSATGLVALISNILEWDAVNKCYKPYSEAPEENNDIITYGALYNWHAIAGIIE